MSLTDHFARLRRRDWLTLAPVGLAGVGITAHITRGRRASSPDPQEPLSASLYPGRSLERWTVVRAYPIYLGGAPVILATARGQRYQVDVLARDPSGPAGVASTEHLSVFVVNSHEARGRDGGRPTDEEQGLGAMALARALDERGAVSGLLTLGERRRRYPGGSFGVPLT